MELKRADAYLDTLAVAYAANGNFHEAIKVQEEAIQLTTSGWYRHRWRAQIDGYRKGKTYREQQQDANQTE